MLHTRVSVARTVDVDWTELSRTEAALGVAVDVAAAAALGARPGCRRFADLHVGHRRAR